MRFGPLPLDEANGEILAHNISDAAGRRILRKGRRLEAPDLDRLRELGHRQVYVARLDPDDVHEDDAARRVAELACGPGLDASAPHTGRVNLTAAATGVVRIDLPRLDTLNGMDGVTVATLRTDTLVRAGDRTGTVKIIPYAIPRAKLDALEASAGSPPVMRIDPIPPGEVAILLVGGSGVRDRMENGIGRAIRHRIEAVGCSAPRIEHVPLDEELLSEALESRRAEDPAMIVIAGETAIMDLDDLIPRGVRSAGGVIEDLGLAMDPGQLLLLGYLDGVPVVGAPGCVRGSAPDGFDAVVPRLLAGERLDRKALHALAHGGLLSDPRGR